MELPLKGVKQVSTYDDPAAAASWRRAAASRAEYLAAPTVRLLDLTGVGPGARVLAVGVGTGGEAVDAALRVGRAGEVVATDRSAAMIAQAEQAVAEKRLVNIHLLVMDAQRLDFSPETFDAVISRNALMFIPDLPEALAEMRRVLKVGGRIGATVWASRHRNPRISGPLDAARALGATPPLTATFRIAVRLGAPAVFAAALRNAGFSDVVVERWPVVARFETLDEAVAQAMDHGGTRELIRLLRPGSEERMRRSLQNRWRRYTSGRQVRLPGEQLVAVGTK